MLSYYFSFLKVASRFVLGGFPLLLIHGDSISSEDFPLSMESVVLFIKEVPDRSYPTTVVQWYCREEADSFIPSYLQAIIKRYYYEKPGKGKGKYRIIYEQVKERIISFFVGCCLSKACAICTTCVLVTFVLGTILALYGYCFTHPTFSGCVDDKEANYTALSQ